MKKKYILIMLTISCFASAQVGINNDAPKSTFDITASRPTGTLNPEIKDGIIIPNIDRGRAQAIGNNSTPVTTHSTLIYVNSIATGTSSQSAINIGSTGFYYFDTTELPAPGAWMPIKSSINLDTYGAQLRIPPHRDNNIADFTNHSVSTYDSDNWFVISKSSTSSTANTPAKMIIVYEFQGSPFNLTNLYPQLTVGNNSALPDAYGANVISILNNGTAGRTRLTVSVVRIDNFTNSWAGTFLLNVLLSRRLN